MPLLFSKKLDNVSVGVWDVREDAKFFLDDIHLYDDEKVELAALSERKKIHWLSSRYLLHQLTNDEKRLITTKDNFGKPYLADSNLHISLSHSDNLAAALVGNFPLGIDIQMKVEKLLRIRAKFLSEREIEEISDLDNLELIHIYWGAKECLFKAYGKGQVDFRKHLYIKSINQSDKTILGIIDKQDTHKEYQLQYKIIGDSVLVFIDKIIVE
jgi:phosphopantetheinyl transferase